MSTTTKAPRQKSSKAHKKAQLVQDLSQLKLLGECVFWTGVGENWGKKNTRKQVEQALTSAGLDPKLAKDFSWEVAFSRTLNELKEQRKVVIDPVRDDTDELLVQLSGKREKDDLDEGGTEKEVEWKKETKILLNKNSGHLTSKNPRVLEIAKELLKKHKEERNTSDISSIVEKLFEGHSDLIPFGHGMFFVPEQFTPFTDQVHAFMKELGREMGRLPIPAGVGHGPQTVQSAIVSHVDSMLEDLKKTVDKFDVSTRPDTMSKEAGKINSLRSKLEAYATYFGDKIDEVKQAIEEANTELVAKIEEVNEKRKNLPPDEAGGVNAKAWAILNGQPKTMKQIMEEIGTTNTCYNLMNKLIKEGKVVKEEKGYRLA